MALTQLAIIRYQALDKCFSDHTRYYYIEDLVRAVNNALRANGQRPVSKRTVQYAINQMEGNPAWEVIFEEPALINGRRYYRYADANYSIWRRDLNEHQLAQLKSMLLMLQQFHGLPQFERIEELVVQLEEHYHFKLADPKDIIAFDTNAYVDGMEHIGSLFEAIVNQQALKISYCPFGKTPYTSIVSPYYIKQYNNRWFVFVATDKNPDRLTNMALDRIQSIEYTSEPFVPNAVYDFEEYFEDMIGVTKPVESKAVKISLRFSEHRLPYVLSKPIHESQRNHRAEERIIELKLIPNKEFYQRILSFGSDVEILDPLEIRQEMADKAEKLYNLYKK